MDIIEIKEILNKLEEDIGEMIKDFEKGCHVTIKYINVRRIDVSTMSDERSILNKVTITAEL